LAISVRDFQCLRNSVRNGCGKISSSKAPFKHCRTQGSALVAARAHGIVARVHASLHAFTHRRTRRAELMLEWTPHPRAPHCVAFKGVCRYCASGQISPVPTKRLRNGTHAPSRAGHHLEGAAFQKSSRLRTASRASTRARSFAPRVQKTELRVCASARQAKHGPSRRALPARADSCRGCKSLL